MALAGGTGSAKILRGLERLGQEMTVISNVGDNVWMHGLYVCPDIDIAMYSLAGVADIKKGWGVADDTFNVQEALGRLGEPTWFNLGDKDLGVHILRTRLLRGGKGLTAVTDRLRRGFGVRARVLPATDDEVETHISTSVGTVHLQDYWVRLKARPKVKRVVYRGASRAKASPQALKSIAQADRVIVCPANPVTSIGPIIAIPGIQRALTSTRSRVVALSPMIGSRPFSGPAAKLMKAQGLSPSSVGIAEAYSEFLDCLLVDRSDETLAERIRRKGPSCVLTDASIRGPEDEVRLARELVAA
ncbi:MAG: 2-phospho-L-lactate transferase [archaeon]|nr:MAG: 2-phospho-L-lactate transferase [archaeon]